jgi:hypothetical protein
MKEKIVLVKSAQMGKRKEHSLVRIPKRVRSRIKPGAKTLEIYKVSSSADRDKFSKALEIRQAYKADLQLATKLQKEGELSQADRNRLAFVSSTTFKTIVGGNIRSVKATAAYLADTVEDILIGTDPEFALKNKNGSLVHALTTFEYKYLTEPLGADDYGLQVELRPDPSTDHKELVKTMRSILQHDPKVSKISDYKWWVTSYDSFGFGGHIHLGNTRILEAKKLSYAYYVIATRLLDELVAIPHSRVEGKGGTQRRAHTRFGHCGDFRNDLKPQRLEWRTIGADWIAHPDLAKAVFGTVKAIVEDLCNRIVRNGYSLDYLIPPKYRKDYFAGYTNKNCDARVHFRSNLYKYAANDLSIYWPTKDVNWSAFPAVADLNLGSSSKDIEVALCEGKVTATAVKKYAKCLRQLSTYSKYKADIERFIKVCTKSEAVLEKKLRRDMRETWLDGKAMFKQ